MSNRNAIIVMPAYNESGNIYHLVKKLRNYINKVIVVDDGSKDNTSELAETAGATVIHILSNSGYTNAVMTGFKYAIDNGSSEIVTFDADGAHNPDEVLQLINKYYESKSELFIGNRFDVHLPNVVSSSTLWANFFASRIMNLIMGTQLIDVSCGFRIYDTKLALTLMKEQLSSGYGLPYHSIVIAINSGYKVSNYPVSVYYDASKVICTKKIEFIDLLSVLVEATKSNYIINTELISLSESVYNLIPLTIKIDNITLCLHPIITESSYLFQAQNTKYERIIGRLYDFDQFSAKKNQFA
ncbi:MAG: glycosyltransferase family 2 protein [Nitrospirae bacterium]|nr:glycosyltransferase family 2 protein [Nitrospirota bacterium]